MALAGCAGSPPRRDPLTAEAHNDVGVLLFGRGDARGAAREFERALALRPGWARALVNLGDARLALGEIRPAIAAYELALAATPDDPGTANNLAWALLQDGQRWPEAEPLVRRALARDPQPRGYYLDTLGVALLRRGDARGALEALRAALGDPAVGQGPARRLVLRHLAEAHARLGDAAGAARCRALLDAPAGAEASPAPERRGRQHVGDDPGVC